MKKLFALVLALALSLSVFAVAETSAYTNYTHPVLGYTVQYPADWFTIDSETLVELLPLMTEATGGAFDYESFADQVIQTNMAMFMNEKGDNINITVQSIGIPVTADTLLVLMGDSLIATYESMFENIAFIDKGSVYETNGKQYVQLIYAYNMVGTNMTGYQYLTCESGNMYTFSMTSATTDTAELESYIAVLDNMLATFAE